MKKMMFNDKYGLTQAVLEKRKTMTRRIVPQSVLDHYLCNAEDPTIIDAARYEIGDVVAIAQAYKELYPNADFRMVGDEFMTESVGWKNKMFVRADLMPHHIKITNIKVERLQDIANEDCMREGVHMRTEQHPRQEFEPEYTFGKGDYHAKYPIAAFAALIDKVSGNGTWERNPFVFAYEFELID